MGADLCGDKYVAFQVIALGLHIQKLGCYSQSAERAVAIGYEADHLRTRADATQTSQKTDGGSGATLGLTVGTRDADLYHISAALRSFQRIDFHVGLRIYGLQIFFNSRAVYRTAVKYVKYFHNLFNKHGVSS